MSALAIQQAALLQALRSPRIADALGDAAGAIEIGPHALRGLRAYRSNARSLATRALGAAFPVTAKLVGEEAFGHVAAGLWQERPPARGDLAEWGGDLPAHLEGLAQLQEEPYLADVARVEWAFHRVAGAQDAQVCPGSFAALGEHDPAVLFLRLAPGTFALRSAWPVAAIIEGHEHDDPDLLRAARAMHERRGECVVVWREGQRPRMRAAAEPEYRFLAALLRGEALAHALDAAGDFDFSAWLAPAVQCGLLLETRAIPSGESR